MCTSVHSLQKNSEPMDIILVGAGNLATQLGKALHRVGHSVKQVYSHTEASAKTLAEMLNCRYTIALEEVVDNADIYIIAVKDSALPSVAKSLVQGRENSLFVHTAGSMPIGSIPARRRGVFYPMQTFSKQRDVPFHHIPCFIEAEQMDDLQLLKDLASTISDDVHELDSDNRQYLHLAAVFCCNFANHCFSLGAQLLQEHGGVPFRVMLPLIEETAAKLRTLSPKEAQTGPAVRWDTNVIDKQMRLLSDQPNLQNIYEILSKSIHND